MKILLTNDDGVSSMGLKILFDALSPMHEVTVVAPARSQNATSHSITLRRPLKIRRLNKNIISVYGTPADCIILAVYHLLDKLPDFIISGVNFGPNLGEDVMYSGTVGGATEGAIIGIPSVALSFYEPKNPDFKSASEFVLKIIEKVKSIPKDVVLNINIPYAPKGVKITCLGKREYVDVIEKRRGGYLIGGTRKDTIEQGTDFEACEQGYISITPLRINLTCYESIPELKDFGL